MQRRAGTTTLAAPVRRVAPLALILLAACDGPQSALSPGGEDAIQLGWLFWVMLAGSVVLWLFINGLFFLVTRRHPHPMSRKLAEGTIVAGGIGLPLVVLTSLLAYGLSIMPHQREPGDGLRLRVTGEEWWWRVEYWPEGATEPVVSANEVRLPVGQRSDLELHAADVIHSFWLPGIAGKTDMIPGRVNHISMEPVEAGTFRGQCAEFCGLSHALMAFQAVTMEPADFDGWLAAEAEGISENARQAEGHAIFQEQGCGACHALRGTEARGEVGPDLTHVGGRGTLAAGVLPMTAEALADWIAHPEAFKPGVEMPGYNHMDEAELLTLATWLEGLK
ncbi:Cytochrome c oxidase polypeptide II [Rubellimicrobium mesophilum DSM 19309]|uniref:Cytochrome c oxidase polypeptide II n=1 Tax=Rubellimicrobium mesophilum DSM 19309 TaxID=442562 RepID=A0A017HL89_9RHOB|nr:cytochrome c oxidase subunit II [Rubellimicrobium mesophilum]EYD75282.1 Cytochrome c oxidase polypeptide II [Rubellimicrobium mesophilum DSM 19309]